MIGQIDHAWLEVWMTLTRWNLSGKNDTVALASIAMFNELISGGNWQFSMSHSKMWYGVPDELKECNDWSYGFIPCVLLPSFHVNAGWQKLFVWCIMRIKICCWVHYIVKLACPYESISVCPYESVCIRTKDHQRMEWLEGYRKAAQLRQVGSVARSVNTTPLKVTLRLVFLGVQHCHHEF